MKKNRIALAIILIILVMTLVACGDTVDATDKSDIDDFVVTIHPNNGDPNVKWDISDPIPKFEKEGFEIEGYYLDSDFTTEVVLTSLKKTGINGDIDIYIKWKRNGCDHEIVIDEAVPATCTEKGLTEGKHCSKCGEVLLAQTEVSALGHTAADAVKENEIAPTCTTTGSYDSVVYCSVCDAEISRETITVDALGHKWIWVVDKNATVTETGLKHEECSVCHIKRNENTTIDILDCSHQGGLVHHEQVDATCTEDGTIEYWYCTACDKKYTDAAGQIIAETIVIPSTGHTGDKAVQESVVAATCTTAGSYDSVVYCSVCDAELSRETKSVDALDHNIVNHNAQAPTCTEIGWEAYETCSRCDHTTYVEIPATGHNHVPAVTEPTCTEKGYTTYTCHCGDTYVADEADALGHDIVNHEAKAPTCTEVGWNTYETCSRCDYTTYEEIPLAKHTYGDWVEIKLATCTEDGLELRYCICGATETKVIKSTGHSHGAMVTYPTCIEEGYITYTCHCGDTYVADIVTALGHDTIDHEAQAPTCTEIGWDAYETCTRCDYTTYAEIPATGHTYSSDCDIVCNVCEHERVPSVSHTYDNSCDTTCNDCSAVRTIEHTYLSDCDIVCNVCEHERVPSVSHTYDNTCDTTCNDCGAVRTIDHTYDNTCDTICNICEDVRTIEHTYSSDCDTICNVCKYERTALVDHTAYDNTCDTTCNECGAIREIEHTYSSDCDIICNVCEHERVSSVDHTYDNACDTNCNICGTTRKTNHSDVNPADNSCDNCGASVSTLTFTLSDDGQSYAITDANSNISGDITIPSTYNGKPVTTIGEEAFSSCYNLTNVTFGENSQLTTISYRAFDNCTSLTSITIPDSVTTIGEYAFYNCTSLTSIVIPDSVTTIGSSAFYKCTGLTSVTIPFVGATKDGTKDTHFGYIFGASSYGYNSYCVPTSLKEVIITGGTTIGERAFDNCTSLTSITIPDSVTTIGSYAFYECTSLTSVTFGENSQLTTIGEYAFSGCSSLTSITIPDSVTTIGSDAFGGCSSLESLTIPFVGAKAGVTGSNTYQYPLGYIFGTSSYTGGVATEQYYYGSNTLLATSTTYYIPSSLKSVTVTDGNILYGAFYNCNNITNITLGDDVTTIGKEAFYNCDSLTSIVIPDSVTTISQYAFSGCTSLTSVTIGDSVTTISQYAFSGCTSLTSITIPASVTSIGSSAFSDCSSLTSITISDSVTTIGEYAFSDCSSLTSIVIPDSVTSIGADAFSGCSSLESLTIPFVGAKVGVTDSSTYQYPLGYLFGTSSDTGGVATEQKYYGSSTLRTTNTTYYIPSSLKSVTVTGGNILYGAFYNCNNITNITLGDDVTTIGKEAFYNCDSLTSIVIPDSVTTIGKYAFDGYSSLTDVYYTGTEEQWKAISIGAYNESLTNATIHYDYVPEEN